jgi:ATP-dependent RNA helicase DBP3
MTTAEEDAVAKAAKKALKKANKAAKKAAASGADAPPAAAVEAEADTAAESKADKKKRKREASAAADSAVVPDAEPDVVAATEDAGSDSDEKKKAAKKAKKAAKKSKKDKAAPAAAAVDDDSSEPAAAAPKKSKKDKGGRASSSEAQAAATAAANTITVDGMDVTPMTDFTNTGFPGVLTAYTRAQKFTRPTPIQSYCWPVLNAGRDIVGIAETGSGKTLAFSLPGLTRILAAAPRSASNAGPFMLVLAPTRELALQSAEVIAAAGKACGVESVCVYGGVPKFEQKKALNNRGGGAHVVVATPGRLKDLCGEGACDLSRVTYLVLDEADRMLDMGFEQDVREIISWTAQKGRQTAMFSATWPKEIRELAEEFLTDPVKVTVGDDDLTANVRVQQNVEVIAERDRDARLLELLAQCHSSRTNRVLVFALYKKEAVRIEQMLARKGWKVSTLHSSHVTISCNLVC